MKDAAIERIRRFTRFYLPRFDLLGNHYLGSEYSAAEARVLYEIYVNDGCTAATIAKTMNLDKSYLSRIIHTHAHKGYLTRTPSPADSRAYELHLTCFGAARVKEFIRKSNEQVAEKISSLSDEACVQLIAAFDTITNLLEEAE